MDWFTGLLWHNGKLLGIEWSFWKIIGWCGNVVFSSRFLVQWYATEKHKRVVIPPVFWWLSLAGTLLLLSYGLFYLHDSVFTFAYAFTWIPYTRNLVIHRRHNESLLKCGSCKTESPNTAHYCAHCGGKLRAESSVKEVA